MLVGWTPSHEAFGCGGGFMKAFLIPLAAALVGLPACAQVFTVTPQAINPKYLEFHRTDVPLSTEPVTRRDREELVGFLSALQGFAMRPLPVAVLKLRANGALKPSGLSYEQLVQAKGMSVGAGKRVEITNVWIKKDSIRIDLDGGPFRKHRWLRHISIGTNPYYTMPVVPEDENHDPAGTRIDLLFRHGVPELTGMQVEALLRPLIDFGVKTPVEAYAETLPPFLRKAVKAHHVLVGMNREMVLAALGEPHTKMQEAIHGQMMHIWIYGEPPAPTEFVRFYGERVVRVILAPVDRPMETFAKNQMGDYWSTQPAENVHYVQLGDTRAEDVAQQDANTAPPTLLNPGEKLPAADRGVGQMKPVIFPKGMGGAGPGAAPAASGQQGTPAGSATQAAPAASPQ